MRKKFDQEWREAIAVLPAHEGEALIAVILDYQTGASVPESFSSPLARALFMLIKPVIDRRARMAAARRRQRERRRHMYACGYSREVVDECSVTLRPVDPSGGNASAAAPCVIHAGADAAGNNISTAVPAAVSASRKRRKHGKHRGRRRR